MNERKQVPTTLSRSGSSVRVQPQARPVFSGVPNIPIPNQNQNRQLIEGLSFFSKGLQNFSDSQIKKNHKNQLELAKQSALNIDSVLPPEITYEPAKKEYYKIRGTLNAEKVISGLEDFDSDLFTDISSEMPGEFAAQESEYLESLKNYFYDGFSEQERSNPINRSYWEGYDASVQEELIKRFRNFKKKQFVTIQAERDQTAQGTINSTLNKLINKDEDVTVSFHKNLQNEILKAVPSYSKERFNALYVSTLIDAAVSEGKPEILRHMLLSNPEDSGFSLSKVPKFNNAIQAGIRQANAQQLANIERDRKNDIRQNKEKNEGAIFSEVFKHLNDPSYDLKSGIQKQVNLGNITSFDYVSKILSFDQTEQERTVKNLKQTSENKAWNILSSVMRGGTVSSGDILSVGDRKVASSLQKDLKVWKELKQDELVDRLITSLTHDGSNVNFKSAIERIRNHSLLGEKAKTKAIKFIEKIQTIRTKVGEHNEKVNAQRLGRQLVSDLNSVSEHDINSINDLELKKSLLTLHKSRSKILKDEETATEYKNITNAILSEPGESHTDLIKKSSLPGNIKTALQSFDNSSLKFIQGQEDRTRETQNRKNIQADLDLQDEYIQRINENFIGAGAKKKDLFKEISTLKFNNPNVKLNVMNHFKTMRDDTISVAEKKRKVKFQKVNKAVRRAILKDKTVKSRESLMSFIDGVETVSGITLSDSEELKIIDFYDQYSVKEFLRTEPKTFFNYKLGLINGDIEDINSITASYQREELTNSDFNKLINLYQTLKKEKSSGKPNSYKSGKSFIKEQFGDTTSLGGKFEAQLIDQRRSEAVNFYDQLVEDWYEKNNDKVLSIIESRELADEAITKFPNPTREEMKEVKKAQRDRRRKLRENKKENAKALSGKVNEKTWLQNLKGLLD